MSSKIPKTGLAGRMRDVMRGIEGSFTVRQIYDGLALPPGKEREKVRNVMTDFLCRGEVAKVTDKRIRRQPLQRYRYVGKVNNIRGGKKREKIFKAMRLVSFHEAFAISDIQRMTGTDRSYIEKLTRKLVQEGHLKKEGKRPRSNSYGKESLYRVVNTDRFRTEVMQ